MASLNLKKYSGEHFLKPDDVRGRPLKRKVAGIREGKFGKPDLIFTSGDVLGLNATNVNILRKAYGDDSANLIDKVIELSLGQFKYNGTLNDGVLVKPVTPPDDPAADDGAPAADKPATDYDDEIPF
jgi:hypothetical protein